jgi:hypothetical protein
VTMTPVTKLGGLKGTIAGAFQLEPDGLRLLKPVTLTIDVSATSGLKAFTYSGNGTDFHLYPLKVEGGKATLQLIHFSGYGVGEGLPQPAIARVRQFLTTKVKPLVAQAKGDSRYFAVAAITTWELLLEMAGLPTDDFVELYPDFQAVQADLAAALRKFADDQHQKCAETHDIVGTAKETEYTLALVVPLLFIKSQPLADAVSYARAQIAKCKSFELDFDSVLTGTVQGGHATMAVRVRDLKLDAANGYKNQAPLDYYRFEFVSDESVCSVSTSTKPDAPFQAQITLLPDTTPALAVAVVSGGATENVTINCPDVPPGNLPPAHLWEGLFAGFHMGSSFTIADWDLVGTSVFARKTYSQTIVTSDGTATEQTSFQLRHTPE